MPTADSAPLAGSSVIHLWSEAERGKTRKEFQHIKFGLEVPFAGLFPLALATLP